MGFGSKMVITGDITQIDLPNPSQSGLLDAIKILDSIEQIAFCELDSQDIVRHQLVKQIVSAYDQAQ
jgi:phosphate starvation-inducible PhoH-like protein